MSMSLLSSLNHSATGARSLRRVFCRSLSVSTSSFFSSSTTSSISTTRQPRGHSTPKSWLEQLYPAFFTDTPIYPDVLRIKSLTSNGSGAPHDLSSLRPPPLPFVPPPQPKKNGRITLLQRLRYRWRRAAALKHFYKQGIAQIWENVEECTMLRKRLAPAGASSALAAIYGGSSLTVQGKSISIPQISRREFQLLLRHGSDFARLPGFALVFWLFRSWTPIIAARVPSTCERPSDRSRQLKALCHRYECFAHNRNDKLEKVTDNSHLTITEQGKELHTLSRRRLLRWHYVVVDEPLCKLIPWIPYAWTEPAARFFDRRCRDHYRSILADTVLIMREGGFNTLSADDIYEYCVRCASPTFINYAKHALQNGVNPASEAMRKAMVPVLEARAKRMLAIDWRRLHPGLLGLIEPLSRLQDREHPDSVWGRTG